MAPTLPSKIPRPDANGSKTDNAEEQEDDYMSMNFSAPQTKTLETSIQRRARKQREAEARSRARSAAEIREDEAAAREAALATSLDSSNKGFRMMQKLGFKGGALGKGTEEARTEPVQVVMKEDRGGIGLDSERKRKFREEVEGVEKKVKAEEGEYRERVRREREDRRIEGMVTGAMVVAERLDEKAEREADGGDGSATEEKQDKNDPSTTLKRTTSSKPLAKTNIHYRALVKRRLEKDRDRRMRHDLHQSLSRLPTYEDPDEDADFKRALGREEEEVEEEDPELDEFLALEAGERLGRLVGYLRERHRYCFWCKFHYSDAGMEGCPGVTEEEHD